MEGLRLGVGATPGEFKRGLLFSNFTLFPVLIEGEPVPGSVKLDTF